MPQEPRLDPTKDVRGNLEEGVAEIRGLLARFEALSEKLGTDLTPDAMQAVLDQQQAVQDLIEAKDGWDVDRHLELASEALRLPPWDADVSKLSGGERRRVGLCRALMAHPDLLLLDEPTNHLDASTTEWLEHFLTTYHGAWLLVTHDRWFLEHSTNQMVELDRGRIFVFQGNYSAFLEAKSKRLETETNQESARQRILARELEWIRSTPAARRVKSKSRIARFHELEEQELEQRRGVVELRLPTGPRLGDKVITIDGVSQGLRRPAPDRQPLARDPARRHRRHRRRERDGQDDAAAHDHGRRAAQQGQDHARGEHGLLLRGPEPRLARARRAQRLRRGRRGR